MDNNKTRVSVFVAGQRFNILTEKSEKYVLDIASRIDARINSLVIANDMTRERAAVLTALDFADDNEKDKESIAAVKEQMKDYLGEIERLRNERTKLSEDYRRLKEEYERLISENRSAEEAQKELAESQKQVDALRAEVEEWKAELESFKQSTVKTAAPAPEVVPVPDEETTITAEDDLFFDEEEDEKPAPQPAPSKKKNRHEHNHVNPYQQKAAEKEKKGYTQQRQYSFFDLDEAEQD